MRTRLEHGGRERGVAVLEALLVTCMLLALAALAVHLQAQARLELTEMNHNQTQSFKTQQSKHVNAACLVAAGQNEQSQHCGRLGVHSQAARKLESSLQRVRLLKRQVELRVQASSVHSDTGLGAGL